MEDAATLQGLRAWPSRSPISSSPGIVDGEQENENHDERYQHASDCPAKKLGSRRARDLAARARNVGRALEPIAALLGREALEQHVQPGEVPALELR